MPSVDEGMTVALGFFGLSILLVIGAEFFGTLITAVKRLLG